MRTTLIYAGIVGHGFGTAGKGMDSGWISHALCILGACAKKAGFEVDLIDLRALSGWDNLRSELLERRPDVVGLTMMSVDYNPVMRSIELVKELLPEAKAIVGGPHPTLALEEVAENPRVDYIVTHEGEISFVELLRRIAAGQNGQRVIVGEKPDLDLQPFADRDLFLHEWRKAGYTLDSPEVPMGDLPAPFVTVIAGRGCMYNCSFCQPAERRLFGGRVRRRSVANVIGELKLLRDKYVFKSLLIHDDCLTEDREWVKEFVQAYGSEGFTQPFFCQSRADIVVKHQDLVELMRGAGLAGMMIGFESGSQRVLKFLRKGTTVEQNLEAGRICHRLGIQIWANYMLGLPTETKQDMMDTVKMLKEIDPDYYSPAFYTPHPGSDLYTYCTENDLSLIKDHDGYRRNPTEVKIKGHDYQFLQWALRESQRRRPWNALRRVARSKWRRYASPSKVVRKLRRLVARQEDL
ncbi:MAG: B12-binding domain-containing radical SAM protein [Chloroflexi bacterium]|nr:B12-binding domain-containing radical SAM protein [Chloroflexota bacterium]